ncbi:unnamed protein product [Mucor hiemalis]
MNQSAEIPTICILKHTDSYLQKTTYFPLQADDRHTQKDKISSVPEVAGELVAIKRNEGEKKPRSKSAKIGTGLDQKIISCITNDIHRVYEAKWDKFQKEEGKKFQDFDSRIEAFERKIPKKSFPSGLINEVKVKIEDSIRKNEIDGFSEANIPHSRAWFQNKVSRMKSQKMIGSAENFVDEFIAALRSGNGNHDNSAQREEENQEIDYEEEQNDEEEEDFTRNDSNGEQIRTVSRTLKNVMNHQFCYSDFLLALESLQSDCKKSIIGLSKALKILIDLILSGKAVQDPKLKDASVKITDFDILKDNIFEKDSNLVFWKKEGLDLLHNENFFSYQGFWKILSFCVGRKRLNKKSFPILDIVNEKMSVDDVFAFKTTPALHHALKQYHVNFCNMWSLENYRQDLKVVITLLLRINLARKRFFAKKTFPKRDISDEKKKQKSRKKFKKQFLCEQIFQILMKIREGNDQKHLALQKVVESLFAPRKNQADQGADGDAQLIKVDNESDAEDEGGGEEDEEDLLNPGLTTPAANDTDTDLTRKELNALTSVAMMLCDADSIKGEIEPEYVKKQLFIDKQETISDDALLACSKIVNLLRKISLKGSEEASFLDCYHIRNLRNALVNFAGKKTKYTERQLFPKKDQKSSQSILVNHATLYLLFGKQYTMFDMNKNPFTSYQGIQSDEQKEALFSNFFNWKKIQRILKEQKLKPSFLISFNNQYDIQLYGKKPASQEQEGSSEKTRKKELSTKVSQSEVKSLNEKIKVDRNEYRHLVAKLKIEEANRMDLGREFRAKGKKREDMGCCFVSSTEKQEKRLQ